MEFKIDYFYDYNKNCQIDNFDMSDKSIIFEENLFNTEFYKNTIKDNVIKLHDINNNNYSFTLIDNTYIPFGKFIIDNYGNVIISIRYSKYKINDYDIILYDDIYYNIYLINNYDIINTKYLDLYKKYFYGIFIEKNFAGYKLLYDNNHNIFYTHIIKKDIYGKIKIDHMYYININIQESINNITNKLLLTNIKFMIIKYQEFLNFINEIDNLFNY
jgi:hypothetical protein